MPKHTLKRSQLPHMPTSANSEKKRPRKCRRTGKWKLGTAADCKRLIEWLRVMQNETGLHFYRCDHCGALHVGHRVPSGLRKKAVENVKAKG